MKPVWMTRKDEERGLQRERARERVQLLERIKDVCWDIDIWRDIRPGTTFAEAGERLGEKPTLWSLRVEHGRLLRQASLRGAAPEEHEEEVSAWLLSST